MDNVRLAPFVVVDPQFERQIVQQFIGDDDTELNTVWHHIGGHDATWVRCAL